MSRATITSWKCRDFLSNAFMPAPIIISREDLLVVVGTLLAARDIPCAIFIGGRGEFESIYGYQLVNLILEAKPEELYDRLWLQAGRAAQFSPPTPLPTIQLDDECTKALSLMVANRFGNLLFLDDKNKPAGLLCLPDMVRSLAGKTKSIGISLKEVSSKLEQVNGGESLIEAFRFMMRRRVRRLVVKRGVKFYCFTEREILKALFSLNGIQLLRDDPQTLLKMPIEHLVSPFMNPLTELRGDHDVTEGWVHAAENPSCAVIVDEERIASPWDLVIKPFLAGKLPF